MNECFVLGKIISLVDFKFIINGKNIAIAQFKVKLRNNSIIKVKAYNEIADYCYRELKINRSVFIYGYINTNKEIIVLDLEYV